MVLNDHIDKLFCPLEDPRDSHVSVPVSHFHLELEVLLDAGLQVVPNLFVLVDEVVQLRLQVLQVSSLRPHFDDLLDHL